MATYTYTSSPSKMFMIDDVQLDQVLKVAIDASKKAGNIILGNSGGAEVTKRKANSRDLLTLIDPLCEKARYIIATVTLVIAKTQLTS
jgi:hypothetical protein